MARTIKPIQEGPVKNYSLAKIFQFPLAEMLLYYLNDMLDTASNSSIYK
jgi:hypothetical protein